MQIKEFRKDENYMVVPRIRDRVIFEHFTFKNNSHKNKKSWNHEFQYWWIEYHKNTNALNLDDVFRLEYFQTI